VTGGNIVRQHSIRFLFAAVVGLLSCVAAQAADKVNVAVLNAAGDVGLFIAQERG